MHAGTGVVASISSWYKHMRNYTLGGIARRRPRRRKGCERGLSVNATARTMTSTIGRWPVREN